MSEGGLGYRDSRGASAPTAADYMLLNALWAGVVNDWGNEDRHTKFLDHARRIDGLFEAARRYRGLRDDPERGTVAEKRLRAIELLVTSALLATKSPPASHRAPGWVIALGVGVCITLLGWASYWAWGWR